jgi:hypothetical protein
VARRRPPKGLEEGQTGRFVAAPTSLAEIFAAYGDACAFTGRDLSKEAAADPRGYLLNLGTNPDSLDAGELIPATLDAIFAFERGHLTIGQRYNLLVDLERIDPELLEALNPIGRLRLPESPAFHPSQVKLTPHLLAFATGRRR